MNYMKNLTCISCSRVYRAHPQRYLCEDCGAEGLLEVQYDYEALKENWSREALARNTERSMWRYAPLLPVPSPAFRPPLQVGWTPLYYTEALARTLGLSHLWIKDDGVNPTASLKDRASAVAVAKAREAGVHVIACSSTGNAASSLAGNAASVGEGLQTVIFVPGRAPQGKVAQLLTYGALVISVQGSYREAHDLSAAAIHRWGWYNRNAAINPYLVEGKKTVSLEMAEQLNWNLPDWLVFSVGDGCTLAGAYRGLKDLQELGFIQRIPRFIGVQASGCAPITRAFHTGEPLQEVEENTIADSIAVGSPRNYVKALRALKDTQGVMVNVEDGEILDMIKVLGKYTGLFGEPAAVAGVAGLKKLIHEGVVGREQGVGAVITGSGLKDIKNVITAVGEPVKLSPDIGALEPILLEKGLI